MKKIKSFWPFLVPLVVLIIALVFWLKNKTAPESQIIVGMVETEYYDVASEIPGRIAFVFVEVGDTVLKGQLLAQMKPKGAESIELQSKSAVDAARAQLDLVKNGAREGDIISAHNVFLIAKNQYGLAKSTWDRINALYKDSVVSEEERDIALFKYKASKNEKTIAYQNYIMLKKGAREESIRIAEAIDQEARANDDFVNSLTKNVDILAPHDGVISSQSIHEEEVVLPAAPLLTVMDVEDFHVIIHLPQDKMNNLRIGSVLKGVIPGVKNGKEFEFEVYHTAVQLDFADWLPTNQKGDMDLKTFEIFLHPKEKIEGLIPGMTVGFSL